jgi:hypothetical protein
MIFWLWVYEMHPWRALANNNESASGEVSMGQCMQERSSGRLLGRDF